MEDSSELYRGDWNHREDYGFMYNEKGRRLKSERRNTKGGNGMEGEKRKYRWILLGYTCKKLIFVMKRVFEC